MPLRSNRKNAGAVAMISTTIKTMKCLTVILFTFCLHASAKSRAEEITLSLTNAHLETVFREIQGQSSYRFVYTKEQLESSTSVTINVKKETLETVLEICFRNQPLTYTIEDKHIIVQIREKSGNPKRPSQTVTGRVINVQGQALKGASITIKETALGTVANDQGEFILEDVNATSTLIVSSIGYETQEIPLRNQTKLTVRLKILINSLDETVVVAYGKTTKRLNTGSVSKISGDEIRKQPVTNPISAIQGRAAGVFVNTQNGLPGGNIIVQIRGKGSINAGTDPLYIIDGVPFNSTPLNSSFITLSDGIGGAVSPLNSLNPADIESIEILKDADATAIYGSRAANGVILITTRNGF
jgi:TonB-dependent SusC/RagA subfamily outer membrane receptor